MTIWRMRIACWIPKATDTNSEYVTIIAFPLQKWLQERASLLRYTQIVSCLCEIIAFLHHSAPFHSPAMGPCDISLFPKL
jgi:hypothetical protein